MLKQRILTAAVLILLVLVAIFVLPDSLFMVFVSAVALAAAWEWSRLAGFVTSLGSSAYCLALAVLFFGLRPLAEHYLHWVLAISLLWWLAALFMISVYPGFTRFWNHPLPLSIAGFAVLFPVWLILLYLRQQEDDGFLICTLLVMVAASDIGAYFSGRRFGRRKLAGSVSPNKTWEGVAGGVLGCCAAAAVFWGGYDAYTQQEGPIDGYWLIILLFAVLVALFGVVGDLLESMVKRIRQVKDSGRILPGHGGILDRIDAITAAAPVYLAMVLLLGSPGS